MKSGKRWFKRLLILATILVIAGGGVMWATGMDRSRFEHAYNQVRNMNGQQLSWFHDEGNKKEQNVRQEMGKHDGNREHHEHEFGGLALAAGTIAGVGILIWALKRKGKGLRRVQLTNVTTPIQSTGSFLDAWEKKQINVKETK